MEEALWEIKEVYDLETEEIDQSGLPKKRLRRKNQIKK